MKYIAYEAENHDLDFFETFEDAKKWLLDYCNEHASDEGYSEEVMTGRCCIAKITHVTHYRVTDEKKNYDDEEEWPYPDEFETVGELEIKKNYNPPLEGTRKRPRPSA